MPRVIPRAVFLAGRLHPLLPKLMGVCRTVEAAQRELRWLEDEVLRLNARESFRLLHRYRVLFEPLPADLLKKVQHGSFSTSLPRGKWEKILLQKFVEERSKGTPLSLVVGNCHHLSVIFGTLSNVCVCRESTICPSESVCSTWYVYSTLGNGRMDVGARQSVTTITTFPTELHGRGSLYWIRMYTTTLERLHLRGYR